MRTRRACRWKVAMLIRFNDRATQGSTLNLHRDAEVLGRRNYTRFVSDEIRKILGGWRT